MKIQLNISCSKKSKKYVSSKHPIENEINTLTSSGFRQQQRLIVLQLNTSHKFLDEVQPINFHNSMKPEK